MSDQPSPARRSIHDRIAQLDAAPNPLVDTSLDTLDTIDANTSSFRIGMTGELMVDEIAPLPLDVEHSEPLGALDLRTASAYHLLLVPEDVTPDDLEALAISVWNEAGWLSPGILRLQEGVTLEGPWALAEDSAHDLGVADAHSQVWLLRCPPRRGAVPSEQVMQFDEWARAFPGGMPVGVELKILDVLRRIARRLGGVIRIAGSGMVIAPDVDSAVSLRVYSDQWMPPSDMRRLLGPHVSGIKSPQPDPEVDGMPYALLAPVSDFSQILIGVRPDPYTPRALRWEMWAKASLSVYELVWAAPEEMADLDRAPTRRGRLERSRAARLIETVAALVADALTNAAVIDEDGFLLALDAPLPEEEQPRP